MVRMRALVTRSIRETLHADGYLELETPVLQLVHGGAAARPFRTHLNAFDIDMTMRIALELFLKRAMVGGADRVYEIGRIFRNEGIDSSHSAEFTMLEAYQAWGDQKSIAAITQKVIVDAADAALGTRVIQTPAGEINLDGEWAWKPVYPTLSEAVGQEITPDDRRRRPAAHRRCARRRARRGLAGAEAGDGAVRRDRRAAPAAADLRVRLPADRAAPGAAAPRQPRPDRGLGPDHRRRGARRPASPS